MATSNPVRFSTKYQDDETDLLYYGRRFYNSSLGRWPNRDPVVDAPAEPLYCFARNAPTRVVDFLGLASVFRADVDYRYSQSIPGNHLGQTRIITEDYHYSPPRPCGVYLNKVQTDDVRAYIHIQEEFVPANYDEASNYPIGPGPGRTWEYANVQAHEDAHATADKRRTYTVYRGMNLFYGVCICKPCHEAWRQYMGVLNPFSAAQRQLDHDNIDCTVGYPSPDKDQACDRIPNDVNNLLSLWRSLVDVNKRMQKICGACLDGSDPTPWLVPN